MNEILAYLANKILADYQNVNTLVSKFGIRFLKFLISTVIAKKIILAQSL
jgi:hypothetical protein